LIGVLFGVYLLSWRSGAVNVRAASKEYEKELMKLPRDAVMISGTQTVAVKYWRGVGAGEWDVIGPGSGWPGSQLAAVIAGDLNQGRRVFLDAEPRWWGICSWQRDEIPDIAKLESRFHFRHVFDNVYEIRPSDDITARDVPHLERLLPENRTEEARNCPPTRR